MENSSTSPGQRRRFLVILAGGLSAVLAALAAWPVFRFLAPRHDAGSEQTVSIDRNLLSVGEAYFFNFHGQPAVILENSPGEFIALSAVCTHLGCVIKWQDDQNYFLCPCHAGKFSPQGKVMGGPPPAPLPEYSVAVHDDQLLVG